MDFQKVKDDEFVYKQDVAEDAAEEIENGQGHAVKSDDEQDDRVKSPQP